MRYSALQRAVTDSEGLARALEASPQVREVLAMPEIDFSLPHDRALVSFVAQHTVPHFPTESKLTEALKNVLTECAGNGLRSPEDVLDALEQLGDRFPVKVFMSMSDDRAYLKHEQAQLKGKWYDPISIGTLSDVCINYGIISALLASVTVANLSAAPAEAWDDHMQKIALPRCLGQEYKSTPRSSHRPSTTTASCPPTCSARMIGSGCNRPSTFLTPMSLR